MEAFLRRLYEECVDVLFPETASLPYHGGGHEAEVFLEVHQDATGDSAVAGGNSSPQLACAPVMKEPLMRSSARSSAARLPASSLGIRASSF